MPTAASSSATAASRPSSSIVNRRCPIDRDSVTCIGSTPNTARPRSTSWIAPVTAIVNAVGSPVGPDQENAGAVRRWRLRERRVGGDRRRLGQPVKLLVGDDADNRSRGAPEANLCADRFAIGKEPPRRRGVDERDRRGGRVVAVAEEPPANEPESDGPEILRADAPDGDLRPRPRFGFAADDGERVGEAGIERMVAGDGGRLDAGERGGALEQRGVEGVLLLEVRPLPEVDRIARGRELILGLQHACGSGTRGSRAAGSRSCGSASRRPRRARPRTSARRRPARFEGACGQGPPIRAAIRRSSDDCRSSRRAWNVGISPNTMPTSTATPSVVARTGRLIVASERRGTSGGAIATSARTPA